MELKKHIRSTKSQIRYLLNYMATHKTFANSKLSLSPMEASKKAKEWSALRAVLRKHGPDKSVQQWKQTWRDLKRNMRKRKLEANRNVETFNKDHVVIDCDTFSNDLEPKIKDEFSTEFVDPHESFDIGGASIKEESSIDVNLDIPCSSPMQLILTNTGSFTCTSSASTPISLNVRPASTQTSLSPPYCTHNAPISIFSYPICENISSHPSNCVHNSATTTSHCHSQCCHQKILPDASTDNLQAQQNILLQNLCNLLEEQNSILRMRNRIERSKIRFQNSKRF